MLKKHQYNQTKSPSDHLIGPIYLLVKNSNTNSSNMLTRQRARPRTKIIRYGVGAPFMYEADNWKIKTVSSLRNILPWNMVNFHYNDVIIGAMASQITSLTIVFSAVYLDTDHRKYQSSASLAFVRGIHRRPVNSPHKWPVMRKMFPFDNVVMLVQLMTRCKAVNWTNLDWSSIRNYRHGKHVIY